MSSDTEILGDCHEILCVPCVRGRGLASSRFVHMTGQSSRNVQVPVFRADPSWPKVPNNWVFGEVSSIAVDPQDHVWIIHRPNTVPADQRAKVAPPVLEFDSVGKLITSWADRARATTGRRGSTEYMPILRTSSGSAGTMDTALRCLQVIRTICS